MVAKDQDHNVEKDGDKGSSCRAKQILQWEVNYQDGEASTGFDKALPQAKVRGSVMQFSDDDAGLRRQTPEMHIINIQEKVSSSQEGADTGHHFDFMPKVARSPNCQFQDQP